MTEYPLNQLFSLLLYLEGKMMLCFLVFYGLQGYFFPLVIYRVKKKNVSSIWKSA